MSRPSLAIACVLCFASAAFAGHLVRKSGSAGSSGSNGGDASEAPRHLPSQLGGGNGSSATVGELANRLTDTASASDFARLMKSSANRGRDRQDLIMLRWAKIDPRAAFEFLRDTGNASIAHSKIVFMAWARTDPEAAFSNCGGFGSGNYEAARAKAALDGAFETDPDRAFALFFEAKKGLREHSMVNIHGGVFDHPELALTMIDKHGRNTRWGKMARRFLLESFVEADPQKALTWCQNHVDGLVGDLGQAVSLLAGSEDPTLAIKLFSGLPPERINASVISAVGAALAKTDPVAGLEFIEANTKGKVQIYAKSSMLRSFASRDPAAAAPAIKQLIGQGVRASDAVRSLMESWAQSSPRDAIAWAQSLDSEGTRHRAAWALSNEWYKRDPDGVSEFIDEAGVDQVSVAFLSGIAKGRLSYGSDHNNRRLEWLRSLPARHSSRIVGEVFDETAKDDPRLAVTAVTSLDSRGLRTAAVVALLESKLGAPEGGLGTLVAGQKDLELHKIFLEALKDPSLNAERAGVVSAQIREAN